MDAQFAGLSARTSQIPYQSNGGDIAPITPLISGATNTDRVQADRSLTHAVVLMEGPGWTRDTELSTGIDFAPGAKLVGHRRTAG